MPRSHSMLLDRGASAFNDPLHDAGAQTEAKTAPNLMPALKVVWSLGPSIVTSRDYEVAKTPPQDAQSHSRPLDRGSSAFNSPLHDAGAHIEAKTAPTLMPALKVV